MGVVYMATEGLDFGMGTDLGLSGSGMPKTVTWVGPFAIGLAGTILVTGIAPVIVSGLGLSLIHILDLWGGRDHCPLHLHQACLLYTSRCV